MNFQTETGRYEVLFNVPLVRGRSKLFQKRIDESKRIKTSEELRCMYSLTERKAVVMWLLIVLGDKFNSFEIFS